MSDPIRRLSTLQSPVFLINSRLDLFTASYQNDRRPFSRSYGSILPSSLAMNLSSTLEFSSQLPVSVWGTGCLACFSRELIHCIITATEVLVYYLMITMIQRTIPSVRNNYSTPSLLVPAGTRILTGCPSISPFGYMLGPD